MGCPVRKVVRIGGGSALMCEADRAVDLVSAVVRSVSVPVTVKMRLGWDQETLSAPALARSFDLPGLHSSLYHPDPEGSVATGVRAMTAAVSGLLPPKSKP